MEDFIPVNEPLLIGNEKKYLIECIETGWISSEGPFVEAFERQVATACGRNFGISVTNGTAALDVAFELLDLSPGDEVIVPSFTIISCIAHILRRGATPVFVDADPLTWNVTYEGVSEAVTDNTRAILLVHIYGLPVHMRDILDLAKQRNIFVVEDAAEVQGQTYYGQPCGSFGDISIFSFYPNKQITTGEGGMVLTNNPEFAERARALRNLCFDNARRFIHTQLGWNLRMTNMQAAVGVAQMERLDFIIAKKREIGQEYARLLSELKGIELQPQTTDYSENIYWVNGILLDQNVYPNFSAADMRVALAREGVGTRPFFYPLNLQPVLKDFCLQVVDNCPNAKRLYDSGLYLPSGLALDKGSLSGIVDKVSKVLTENAF